jgi:hypothetical protein
MSLSSHLSDSASPIGQFIKQQFGQTTRLTKAANQRLKTVETLRPVVSGTAYPYPFIGTAIDYRIRYAFAITPYQQLVAWHGALKLILKPWESDDDVLIDWEDLPSGIPIPTPVGPTGNLVATAVGPYPIQLVGAFFESLDATLRVLQPVGKLLDAQAERTLDRYCIVLNLFEQVFRSNAYIQGPLMQPTVKRSVEALLAIPQDAWLDDLSQLFGLFYECYHDLLSRPHILNPTFAGSVDIGGADADLIVDGCLIDIKTSIAPQIRADYLYQLAGYLLLDYTDQFHINSVGIYMARQGILFSWPVEEFLRQLTGDNSISLQALRQEFCVMCQQYD